MLAAMGERSFVVTIAYIKTEPIQVAIFGLIFLGDPVDAARWRCDPDRDRRRRRDVVQARRLTGGIKPDADRACLRRDVRALGHRLSRRDPLVAVPNFVMAATFTLALGLVLQAALLTLYLALRDPSSADRHRARLAALAVRRLHGRAASQFWFLAFAIATAASVRTLALVEVLFAQASRVSSSSRRRPCAKV